MEKGNKIIQEKAELKDWFHPKPPPIQMFLYPYSIYMKIIQL